MSVLALWYSHLYTNNNGIPKYQTIIKTSADNISIVSASLHFSKEFNYLVFFPFDWICSCRSLPIPKIWVTCLRGGRNAKRKSCVYKYYTVAVHWDWMGESIQTSKFRTSLFMLEISHPILKASKGRCRSYCEAAGSRDITSFQVPSCRKYKLRSQFRSTLLTYTFLRTSS